MVYLVMLGIGVLNKSEVNFKIMALGKGKAAKSASGASMSAYDVEVEAKLKAIVSDVVKLQAAVAELKSHTHQAPPVEVSTSPPGSAEARVDTLIAQLKAAFPGRAGLFG